MRFSCLIICCCILSLNLFSQEEQKGTVYLFSGSVIKGKVVSMDEFGGVKVEISGGSILYFDGEEVERVTFEPVLPPTQGPDAVFGDPEEYYATDGWFRSLDAGFLIGSNTTTNTFSNGYIRSFIGYQTSELFSISAGVGLDIYGRREGGANLILPALLLAETEFIKGKITPLAYLYLGNGFLLNKEDRIEQNTTALTNVGLTFGFGSGVRLYADNNSAVFVRVGYNYSDQTYSSRNLENDVVTSDKPIHSTTIAIGFKF